MSRLALALTFLLPLSAAGADAPRAELFGSYSYARSGDSSLSGWNGALDYSLSRSFGLEASVSGHYGSDLGTDVSRQSLLLGPRFAWRRDSITPFVHALGGVLRSSAGIEVFDVSIRESETKAAGALETGLDLKVASRWAVRLQGGYLVTKGPQENANRDDPTGDVLKWDPRASLGIVYRAGRR